MSSGHWYVLIEENGQHLWTRSRWELSHYLPAGGFEHALALAYETAVNHVPNDPKLPQSRTLFRMQDGSWLVHMTGAASAWRFRVSVAQYHGTFPGVPQPNPA